MSLKFGMWSAEGGGSVHSKHRLVSSRQHRATEVRKLRFLSSCQYTHGCHAPASWAARHTTVCLDKHPSEQNKLKLENNKTLLQDEISNAKQGRIQSLERGGRGGGGGGAPC